LGAVPAATNKLNAGIDLLTERLDGRAKTVGKQPFRKSVGNDGGYRASEQFITRITELALRPQVQQYDQTVLVYNRHCIRRGLEQAEVALFHLRQTSVCLPVTVAAVVVHCHH